MFIGAAISHGAVAAPTSLAHSVGPTSAGVDPCGLGLGVYGYCHPHGLYPPHSGEFWNCPWPHPICGG